MRKNVLAKGFMIAMAAVMLGTTTVPATVMASEVENQQEAVNEDKAKEEAAKKEAEKKSLPMTVPIWKTPTSKSVGLGEEMYVSLNVHDSLSGFTCWTRDSDLPLEFMFKTTQNGFLQGLQSGGFVETKKMFHFKDHSGDKANLAFRFHVSLEGRSLESMIKEYKDRDGAP